MEQGHGNKCWAPSVPLPKLYSVSSPTPGVSFLLIWKTLALKFEVFCLTSLSLNFPSWSPESFACSVLLKKVSDTMGWKRSLGLGRYKLLHLEWIGNKVLVYSTGNYTPSLGREHDGSYYEKENVNICMTGSLYIFLYSRNWHNIVN